jgi:hypothetical protein
MSEEKRPPQEAKINFGNLESLVNVSDVHLNVSQEVIVTTEDKIRLCLSSHLNRMEKKKSWVAPLGILLTIIISLFTSDFTDKLLFKAATWQSVFIISAVISFIWLIIAIKDAFQSERPDDIITQLKKDPKSIKK